MAYYDGLNHAIVSVALVVPKAGVFVSEVKHLLVVTTPAEIVVLGVTFGDSTKTVCSPNKSLQTATPYVEMQLMNKPIFILNTDNVSMVSIEGTADGRIFLGGRDGALYELQYQAESNWFGRRCRKVNHSQSLVSLVVPGFLKVFSDQDSVAKLTVDDARGLVYVLYEKGGIEAWELEANGGARSIARLSPKELTQIASNALNTTDPNIFKHVTALCVLEKEEGDTQSPHLMAVTECGVRFYFTTTQQTQFNQMVPQQQQPGDPNAGGEHMHVQQSQQKATGLFLLHVRLPPGYTPNTTVGKPRNVHSAFYHRGTCLMVSTPQPDQDLLWSLSSEPFPMRGRFAESSTILPLDGQVWAMGRVKDKQLRNVTLTTLKSSQQPTKIAILTNHGIHMVSLLKPVDLLQQLLLACHGPHHEAVKAYFMEQKEHEACATSLLLACWEHVRGSEMANWAAQAFFIYGGEPSMGMQQMVPRNSLSNTSTLMSPSMSGFMDQHGNPQNTPMGYASTPYAGMRAASAIQQSLFQQTTRIQSPTGGTSPGMNHTLTGEQNVVYSAKHTGLYLHVMRVLKPLWRRRCLLSKNGQVFSSITYQDCAQVLEELMAIRRFLVEHSVASLSTSGTLYGHSTVLNHHSTFTDNGFQSPANSMVAQYGSAQQGRNGAGSALEEARMEEKRSLDALSRFIRHSCEVLALWKILCEHQFHMLMQALPKEQQGVLVNCSFRDLILLRSDTCFQLIIALINFYLNDNASVASISQKLRDDCPSLYSNEDAVSHKATEIMLLSKSVTDVEEKQERLQTALKLYKSAAPNLPLANICQQFTALGYYQVSQSKWSLLLGIQEPSHFDPLQLLLQVVQTVFLVAGPLEPLDLPQFRCDLILDHGAVLLALSQSFHVL